jgi:hypothetical protein
MSITSYTPYVSLLLFYLLHLSFLIYLFAQFAIEIKPFGFTPSLVADHSTVAEE